MNISANITPPKKQAKPFGVTFKSYFSKAETNIMLNENGELIMENQDIANTLSEYFGSTVENINLLQRDKQSGDLNSKMLKRS